MGIIVDNGDQHLYVHSHGPAGEGRTLVVQYDERKAWLFELTDLERRALIEQLTVRGDVEAVPCYDPPFGGHVPGCDHEVARCE